MSEVVLFAKDLKIVDSSGNAVPIGTRPVVRWREKVSFEVRLPNNASFPSDNYHYAFDYDRDFLHTAPCNAGECTLADGKLTFDVVFNSVRQAKETNGRLKPIPFYIQISTLGDTFAEYILDDAIWVDGCVWDGRIPPAPEAPNYYTKAEVDGIAESKLDKPEEAGETGYVLGLAEDGSTAWIQQTGGHGDVAWEDITDKPALKTVATTGSYNDLTDKPSIPAAQVQSDWNQSNTSAADFIKNKPAIPAAQVQADWNEADTNSKAYVQNKPNLSTVATTGSYNDLSNKPAIPTVPGAATNAQIDDKTATNSTIVPANLPYAVRSVMPNVTVIPANTTAYTLYDASATTNDHCMTYKHAPTSVPTYTLPAVTDTGIAHSIILDVDFTTVQTFTFQDSDGYTLTPQKEISIYAGDSYRFICIYQYGTWLIYPLLMQVTTITPTTPVSITGDTATAISVQLSATAGNSGTLTYTATGLPTGVTCSSSGLISGTPTTAGSYTATVTVSNPYARPATIVVNFTITAGSSVPQTLTVSGTGASSNNLDGTYTLTNDTNNSRPVWYNSTNQKYLYAVENGMDAGWFAWVVGDSVVQQCAGDTMMFYTYCTYDVQGLANLSDTPDQSTTPWYSMGTAVSSSEFSIAVTA